MAGVYRTLYEVWFRLGWRLSEMVALRFRNLDFTRQVIRVDTGRMPRFGGIEAEPKTGPREVDCSYDPQIFALLTEWTEPLERALREAESIGTRSVVEQWLHEADSTFLGNARRAYTDCSSMNVGACEQLYMAYELPTKAVIIELAGALPERYEKHRLLHHAQVTNLYGLLPADLQSVVKEMDRFDPNVRYPGEPAYETLVSSSINAEWERRLDGAARFIRFVRDEVLAKPAVLAKLTRPK